MILIVDTNILFAGLLRNGLVRESLIKSHFILYSPETAIKEIRKYQSEIIKRSGLTEEDFEDLLNLITENINIIEKERYFEKLEEANKLMGHIDKVDVPFIALALSITNDGIWTDNIRDFGKQNKIKIWTTKDILNLLENKGN
ncbi:MAG: hypothetical protein HY831_05245 [Candidatus Aenigmarchaeota archaeon]|nr:hypothetical protein [Candidatus Aenigmarchaeota archaeon]